ncbi:EutN/CcmL family microcompartment protein [Engelhardtia mirabilis]|uniref:Ethanolamine utilization protein EutN n=1 Tax=Engelhardtia mirabilis TaxID=2528011 RepID=A0A518BQ47_9BACT|nr:Ethanolamine utilization protein EutN [Planctomycetes bacterium Pla133]QDV03415.1 Ethanolamine utilization protein EutN [Planctomycetes bacterium Pla86]
MFLADVIGTVVAPVQHPSLEGRTQLLLRPLSPTGEAAGKTRVAIDHVGAGVGDRVIVIDEGNSGRQLLGGAELPIKTIVVGIVDAIEHLGKVVYDHRAHPPLERRS